MKREKEEFFHRPRPGDTFISDQEPTDAKILQWTLSPNVALLALGREGSIAERKHGSLLRKENDDTKVTEFSWNYLLCIIHRSTLVGHVSYPRRGHLFMATWYKTYVNGSQGRHISPRCEDNDIYCVMLNGLVVYRPHLYGEVAAVAPETAGPVHSHLLRM